MKNKFQKKIFSILLEKAKGTRSVRAFAADCNISYVQMRKLINCEQENPPGKKLLQKIAENSMCGIDYDDYAFACGLAFENDKGSVFSKQEELLVEKFRNLSNNQKKTVFKFIDFLDF